MSATLEEKTGDCSVRSEFSDAGEAFICKWMGEENFSKWTAARHDSPFDNIGDFIAWLLSLASGGSTNRVGDSDDNNGTSSEPAENVEPTADSLTENNRGIVEPSSPVVPDYTIKTEPEEMGQEYEEAILMEKTETPMRGIICEEIPDKDVQALPDVLSEEDQDNIAVLDMERSFNREVERIYNPDNQENNFREMSRENQMKQRITHRDRWRSMNEIAKQLLSQRESLSRMPPVENSHPVIGLMRPPGIRAPHPALPASIGRYRELKYPCTFCGKPFPTPSLLRRHMRTHTGEKPFLCYACPYKSSVRHNLKAHIICHHLRTMNLPLCCPKCNSYFAKTKDELAAHLTYHAYNST